MYVYVHVFIYLFIYCMFTCIYILAILACQADAIAAARYLTEEALAKCAGAPLMWESPRGAACHSITSLPEAWIRLLGGRSCGELPTAAEDTAEISEAFVITIILSFRWWLVVFGSTEGNCDG